MPSILQKYEMGCLTEVKMIPFYKLKKCRTVTCLHSLYSNIFTMHSLLPFKLLTVFETWSALYVTVHSILNRTSNYIKKMYAIHVLS